MKKALILVDFQNDYFPGGEMALVDSDKAVSNAHLLLNGFRKENQLIVHVQHISVRPGSTFFLPKTRGVEIHEMVAPKNSETLVTKNYPNSFRETSLLEKLNDKEIEDLVICGAMSHMCIDATTRAAFDFGFNCVVVEDACATTDLMFNGKKIKAADVHASFMAALSVPYARVLNTVEALKEIV